MRRGSVASLRGDWSTVVKAVNTIFGEEGFILLAEDQNAPDTRASLHFRRATSLNDNELLSPGRAFNDRFEVRWREITSKQFIITCLNDVGTIPGELSFSSSNQEWETIDTSQKLYGLWSALSNDWVEVAVPGASNRYQRFFEGVEQPRALKLTVVDYMRDGCVQMTRFRSIAEDLNAHGE
jgi:hypothetical protein